MAKFKLSLACTQTDRSAPILDGRIAVNGCEIIALPGQTQDIFRRVLNEQAFDIAEMSMSSQIVQTGRGVNDYVAIPVYLSRAFRHSSIYIRTDRGIARPPDLAGKLIGIEQFQQTVGVWVRGILGDQYGVRSQDVRWVNGGLEQPGGGERLALKLPDGISLTAAPKEKRSMACWPTAGSTRSSPPGPRHALKPAIRTWRGFSPTIGRPRSITSRARAHSRSCMVS